MQDTPRGPFIPGPIKAPERLEELAVPISMLIFFMIVVGIPVIGGIGMSAFQRWLKHKEKIMAVDFSPDGKKVATASGDRTARIWNAETGELEGDPLKHDAEVRVAIFHPYAKLALTASVDHTAALWNLQTRGSRGIARTLYLRDDWRGGWGGAAARLRDADRQSARCDAARARRARRGRHDRL